MDSAADELDELERAKDRVRVLLDRYGVLFRALVQGERPALRWGAVFRALRIMELGGEVTTGHFFDGIPGLQFMAAAAMGAFQSALPEDAVYWMNATDPASLCGVDVDALKGTLPRRLKSTHVVYHGTEMRLVSERGGKAIEIRATPDAPDLPRYFCVFEQTLGRAVSPRSAINIETINGEAATASPYLPALRKTFEVHTDPKRVSLYKKRAPKAPNDSTSSTSSTQSM
jgi:ATP-dependent Lhr-like helicase